MAPRALETLDEFILRLRRALDAGELEIRFGGHHFTHAVCLEDDVLRVRRLELSREEAEAYLAEHGMFMPEHQEALARPGALLLEAETLDDLERALRSRAWPP